MFYTYSVNSARGVGNGKCKQEIYKNINVNIHLPKNPYANTAVKTYSCEVLN